MLLDGVMANDPFQAFGVRKWIGTANKCRNSMCTCVLKKKWKRKIKKDKEVKEHWRIEEEAVGEGVRRGGGRVMTRKKDTPYRQKGSWKNQEDSACQDVGFCLLHVLLTSDPGHQKLSVQSSHLWFARGPLLKAHSLLSNLFTMPKSLAHVYSY